MAIDLDFLAAYTLSSLYTTEELDSILDSLDTDEDQMETLKNTMESLTR